MERITISVDEKLAKEFDALIGKRGYTSRSEAMRDLLRREVEATGSPTRRKSYCVANLSYVYNHHERDLAERLISAQHQQHDLVVSTMHVHLDHEHCLESVDPQGADGRGARVRQRDAGRARRPPRSDQPDHRRAPATPTRARVPTTTTATCT